MQDIFIARQPIVDRKENLVAFELLFRSAHGSTTSGVVDNTQATAQVLVNAFGEMGIADVLGTHKGFINLDADFLLSDLIDLLPKQQVMLELLETIVIDDTIISRCRELKAKGYSLALDDVFELTPEIISLLGIVDVVKLDLMQIAPEHLPGLVNKLKHYPIKLLAEKVEDREQARICMEMGFDLFQGYHFARPEMLSGKRPNPSKIALVKLLSMMMQDADNDLIEEAFKEQADLTYNLMRMVNSAGTGLTTKISSLKHGMMVLGRQPLRRWVQLLLYASNQGNITVSPLMQLAATRGKLLELIAQQELPDDRDYADRAFMVGILSLLDALMGEPLPEILSRLSLHEEVGAALLNHEGSLGELLVLCDNIETGNLTVIQEILDTHPSLTMDTLNTAQLEALGWANKIVL